VIHNDFTEVFIEQYGTSLMWIASTYSTFVALCSRYMAAEKINYGESF